MSVDPKFDHIDINEKQKVIIRQLFPFSIKWLWFILQLCVFILTCS
jgi:hypothetical protein